MRIAIIGCGKIADQHVAAIRRIPDCQIVAVCDRELLMAQQLGERFGISTCFAEVGDLLHRSRPDVVHVTTPPQSHFSLAKQCLEAGCHVYLEKPLTVTASEAESLLECAQEYGLKMTVGHNYQFTWEMMELRRLVREGFLGGRPTHIESHWSYCLDDVSYVGAFCGNRAHWVRQLPGQLFHNLISHGIAKIAEFLDEELAEIIATAHQSPQMGRLGAAEVLDELRVLIRDRNGTSAYFCFSTQLNPGINQVRVFGPKNALAADILGGTLIRYRARPSKSYLAYLVPPLDTGIEYLRNAWANLMNFVWRRLYQDFGMKELVERFYKSIVTGTPLPIPYREILLTARIMDEIFAQVYAGREKKPRIDANAHEFRSRTGIEQSRVGSDLQPLIASPS